MIETLSKTVKLLKVLETPIDTGGQVPPMQTGRIYRLLEVETQSNEYYCDKCNTWNTPDRWHQYEATAGRVAKYVCINCGKEYNV